MRLMVTGGAGFIGSTLVRLAINKGYFVVNVDALTYAACLDNLKAIESNSNYAFVNADIRDSCTLVKTFKKLLVNAPVCL